VRRRAQDEDAIPREVSKTAYQETQTKDSHKKKPNTNLERKKKIFVACGRRDFKGKLEMGPTGYGMGGWGEKVSFKSRTSRDCFCRRRAKIPPPRNTLEQLD